MCCLSRALDAPLLLLLLLLSACRFSWQPWTVIEATALPAMQLAPGQSKAAFVAEVQLAIARELRLPIVDLTIQQKRALAGSGGGGGGGGSRARR